MQHRGFVLLDKPVGVTSFQALGVVKRCLKTKKVGHTGTLDKFASGIMIICVGSYTRLASLITQQDKEYRARIKFGVQTDTLDPEGQIVATGPIPDYEKVLSVLPGFIGAQSQIPPKYSAVHIDGKRAYKRIRSGEDFDMPSRNIEIYSINAHSYENGVLDVSVACSKGTYIRSLARDIATATGTVGSLEALDRIRVGNITKDQCVSHIDFEKNPIDHLKDGQDISTLLFEFPFLFLQQKYQADFLSGKTISESWFDIEKDVIQNGKYVVFSGREKIAGVVDKTGMKYSYQCVFPDI